MLKVPASLVVKSGLCFWAKQVCCVDEERENLPIIVFLLNRAFVSTGESFEIIVVDDSSPDGTADVARDLMKLYPDRIVLHERAGKLGLGSAYMAGAELARCVSLCENFGPHCVLVFTVSIGCSGEYILILDADMSHHPKYIPKFMDLQVLFVHSACGCIGFA